MNPKVEMLAAYREKCTVGHSYVRPSCKVALVIDGGLGIACQDESVKASTSGDANTLS